MQFEILKKGKPLNCQSDSADISYELMKKGVTCCCIAGFIPGHAIITKI